METKYHITPTIPMLFIAIHHGHYISQHIDEKIGIPQLDRMREEDPFTDRFISDKPCHIIQQTSRFEYDLNRPKDFAIYQNPQDCWGLPIYPLQKLTDSEIKTAIEKYNSFYQKITFNIELLLEKYDKIIVWDVHSYNHHRGGPDAPFDSEAENPEIIIGTNNYKYMPLQRWKPLVDNIENSLKSQLFEGKYINRPLETPYLDVRQNVKFPGGYLSQYINHVYGERLCCIAIEFKKIWMNEWTQEIDEPCLAKLKAIFDKTCFEVLEQLKC